MDHTRFGRANLQIIGCRKRQGAIAHWIGAEVVGAALLCIIGCVPIASAQAIPETGSSNGIVLAPFFSSFVIAGGDASSHIQGDLSRMCGGPPDFAYEGNADVAAFASMGGHGVISISSHGNVNPETGEVHINTGEPVSPVSATKYIVEIANGLIGDSVVIDLNNLANTGEYFDIAPEFVRVFAAGTTNGLVYADVCYGIANYTMADAFIDSGAKAFFGYNGYVRASASSPIAQTVFDTLTDVTQPPAQRTATVAYNSAGGRKFSAGSTRIEPGNFLESNCKWWLRDGRHEGMENDIRCRCWAVGRLRL